MACADGSPSLQPWLEVQHLSRAASQGPSQGPSQGSTHGLEATWRKCPVDGVPCTGEQRLALQRGAAVGVAHVDGGCQLTGLIGKLSPVPGSTIQHQKWANAGHSPQRLMRSNLSRQRALQSSPTVLLSLHQHAALSNPGPQSSTQMWQQLLASTPGQQQRHTMAEASTRVERARRFCKSSLMTRRKSAAAPLMPAGALNTCGRWLPCRLWQRHWCLHQQSHCQAMSLVSRTPWAVRLSRCSSALPPGRPLATMSQDALWLRATCPLAELQEPAAGGQSARKLAGSSARGHGPCQGSQARRLPSHRLAFPTAFRRPLTASGTLWPAPQTDHSSLETSGRHLRLSAAIPPTWARRRAYKMG
mmetsp:Transcript_111658/g.360443  ORF Transcript_111658/g.360443 Transcript_111658/m.360443 type:complete len:360 (+) Transcript_111658:177-1256(+)